MCILVVSRITTFCFKCFATFEEHMGLTSSVKEREERERERGTEREREGEGEGEGEKDGEGESASDRLTRSLVPPKLGRAARRGLRHRRAGGVDVVAHLYVLESVLLPRYKTCVY